MGLLLNACQHYSLLQQFQFLKEEGGATPQVLRLPVKDQTTRKGDVKQSLGMETGISPACYFEQVPKIPAWEVKQTNRQGKRK